MWPLSSASLSSPRAVTPARGNLSRRSSTSARSSGSARSGRPRSDSGSESRPMTALRHPPSRRGSGPAMALRRPSRVASASARRPTNQQLAGEPGLGDQRFAALRTVGSQRMLQRLAVAGFCLREFQLAPLRVTEAVQRPPQESQRSLSTLPRWPQKPDAWTSGRWIRARVREAEIEGDQDPILAQARIEDRRVWPTAEILRQCVLDVEPGLPDENFRFARQVLVELEPWRHVGGQAGICTMRSRARSAA